MRLSTIILLLAGLLLGCSGDDSRKSTNQSKKTRTIQDSTEIKDSVPINKHEPESVSDSRSLHEITFDQQQRFGSTEEVVVGEIADFAVDNRNRVFIADMDKTVVHVFNVDGGYHTSLGRQGSGPAEFGAVTPITTIRVHSNDLYITDYPGPSTFFPTRVQIYNLEDLSFSHTMNLIPVNRDDNRLKGYYPNRIYPRGSGNFLVSYRRDPHDYKDSTSFVRYYIQDSSGEIMEGPILEQKDMQYLTYLVDDKNLSPFLAMRTFDFLEKSLLAVSDDNHLYTARSMEFTIDIYNPAGKQVHSFQHPIKNVPITESLIERYKGKETSFEDGVVANMIREADNLPDHWPALETMFFDDKDRLWGATIVQDFDIYEWWILEKSGEVITKFEWPRDKPIEEVRNGFMYTREANDMGVENIVKYEIQME